MTAFKFTHAEKGKFIVVLSHVTLIISRCGSEENYNEMYQMYNTLSNYPIKSQNLKTVLILYYLWFTYQGIVKLPQLNGHAVGARLQAYHWWFACRQLGMAVSQGWHVTGRISHASMCLVSWPCITICVHPGCVQPTSSYRHESSWCLEY